ncbi:Similar to ORF67.5, Macaca mulatta rhadinovirus 26-95 [Macacine gammaherpesvirus 5]|uniref:Similar to ORF67.5, Macaca mulatta rhadinovirus 26-95 n=1 Tax=Macacine gammaherpesvirus 5 TaxID=154334 RepID=UPI00001637B8|nr:Similar to ORF67.5, Macaca mulatta rhadinovirus 26-95 [Macacine gammaherpesvirus 5]QFQ66845.1 ORF 67.5 [Macacine gammaherpesvirus 5]
MFGDDLLAFESLLPDDMKIMFPTIYSRLNAINYCQYLKTFLCHRAQTRSAHCEHCMVLDAKVNAVKQVIHKIVSTDAVFTGATHST